MHGTSGKAHACLGQFCYHLALLTMGVDQDNADMFGIGSGTDSGKLMQQSAATARQPRPEILICALLSLIGGIVPTCETCLEGVCDSGRNGDDI